MVSAAAVVHNGIVNALNVAVHECGHWQSIICLPFLTLVLLRLSIVAVATAAAAAAGCVFAVASHDSASAILVKVLGPFTSFVRGFDELQESSFVFPCKGYDPHANVLRIGWFLITA